MDEVIKRLRIRRDFNNNEDQCYSYGYGYTDCYSSWYSWGRWVFVAAIIVAFILLFILCAFLARRRRRRGLPPYYGTAWMPFRPNNPNNDPQQFQTYPPQQYNSNGQPEGYYAPPVYTPTPQMTGTHFATNSPMQTDSAYPPPIPPHPSPYYQPPAENPNQTIPHHSTGGSDYYMPPPGPPPAAHVGKY